MTKFRLAVVQMTSTDSVDANLAIVESCYTEAATSGAQLTVFPENTLYFRVQPGTPVCAPVWNGPEFCRLVRAVNERRRPLMLTTALASRSKFKNCTVLFQPDREPEIVYSKIHLFDVDVPGAPPVRESESFDPGEDPRVIEVDGWKFGLSICYDLRFAELYGRYAQKADVMLVPSAFLVPTGEAHWEVLLRARAIESQCFVAAPAQVGPHSSGSHVRHTYGHSMVVDPWGRVLAEVESGSPEVRFVDLDMEEIAKVRRQIPMAGHRRL